MTHTTTNPRVYFDGAPTAPDVEAICEAIPIDSLTPETMIHHPRLEQIIGESASSGRYYRVVRAWRKTLLREHGIVTQAIPGEGVRVSTDPEKVGIASSQQGSALRKIGRSLDVLRLTTVNKLSEQERASHDLLTRRAAMMVGARALRPAATQPSLMESTDGAN